MVYKGKSKPFLSPWEQSGVLEPSLVDYRSVTGFIDCFSNICLQNPERSQVPSTTQFPAVSKNETSGADKTKEPQRPSPSSQHPGELGQGTV